MNNLTYLALIPLLPLFSFLLLGLFGKKLGNQFSGIIGTCSMLTVAAISYYAAYQYFFQIGLKDGVYQHLTAFKLTWLALTPNVSIDLGIILDPISAMMLIVVTTISAMVHIYSMGYMHGEKRYYVYYAFLSLFSFSMLGLVLAVNIFQMYIFWELVGVSSFLLIGFYYDKPSAVSASKKAFIVTRFADLGFMIGILILSYFTETLDFATLIERLTTPDSPYLHSMTSISFMGASLLTWALILVFMGGAGKSAMFPLHIWLPDAMEGPTPVSALIHAATMVVAGVYLVARLFPVYAISAPDALHVVAWVGAFSSFFAAIIACTQTDIKRVLAYSTMSQIGYMMFALGVSHYGGEEGLGFMASMFHLFTHAMFKALLFLGAGAVIHAVHSNEMKDMGGLRKKLPITHITFLIACLTIAGIPPLSGFFSKEEILSAAFHNYRIIFYLGLLTAGITSFYMFRLYFNIFWNKEPHAHSEHGHDSHAHKGEAPFSMLFPLVFLAIASVGAGFIPFHNLVTSDGLHLETIFHPEFSAAPILIGLTGIFFAWLFYKKENSKSDTIAQTLGGLYRAAYRKFYMDEIYLFVARNIIFNNISKPLAIFDKKVIDGSLDKMADGTQAVSYNIRGMQSGKLQQYVFYFFIGAVGFAILFIYLWK